MRSALRVVVAAFGLVVSLAGLEHGIGEVLQGPEAPPGLVFRSWIGVPAFEALGGEPALSLMPNLLVSGLLTVAVSVVFAAWCVRFVHRPRGGPVLIALSLALLSVGGGIAPPILGVILGIAATRIGAPSRRRPPPWLAMLGRARRWLTAAGIAGFLALFPGFVLLSLVVEVDPSIIAPLALGAVVLMVLALVAARAHDRASAGVAAAAGP